MNAPDLIRLAFRELHDAVREDIAQVPEGWLTWQPAPASNHIGFLLWHLVRDEDWVVSVVVRRSAPLWQTEGWAERLDLDPVAQGTGFEAARLGELHYSAAEFMSYAERVWQMTDRALEALTGDELTRPVPGVAPSMSVTSQLASGSIGHSWAHLGEIRYIKGLKGWRYRE